MANPHFLSLNKTSPYQYGLILLCLLVYFGSLLFPLFDKDAAHHANIALYMHEHNNYVNLVDRGSDYLDKPHFLFWISALSFKIFGVNTFAHRFPAMLFAIITVLSTYKLAKHLADKTTARLSAIILATAQAFVLSINDARMETPLTAGIMFGLWQLIVYINKRNLLHLLGAALGAAVAFSTKGWIGPVVLIIPAFFYLLLNNRWHILLLPQTWLFIPVFGLLISPVLYAYYLQYDLHPEKLIRGTKGHSGLRFILWDQLFERTSGFDQGKKGRNSDYFFLYHTFLWAIFPWTLFVCLAIALWFKRIVQRKRFHSPLAFSLLGFVFILIVISFSNFKMPHYIIMLLPLAALFTAPYLRVFSLNSRLTRFHLISQVVLGTLILAVILMLNFYFFQPLSIAVWVSGISLLVILIYALVKRPTFPALKAISVAALSSLVLNFFLNYDFFPNVLKYQGGNELVKKMRNDHLEISDNDIVLVENNAHSFDFYRNHNHRIIEADSLNQAFSSVRNKFFLITRPQQSYLEKQGYQIETVSEVPDYNVATIKYRFLNPATRSSVLDTLRLVRLRKL